MSSDSVVMQASFKCCAYICVCACGLSCVATLQLKIGEGGGGIVICIHV